MKSKTLALSAVVAVAITGAAFAFGPRSSKNQTMPSQQTAQPTASTMPSPQPSPMPTLAGKVREVSITARQFSFEPSTIRIKRGERVRINLAAIDVSHGIAIPEFGLNITASQGGDVSGEFTADKTGTFDFFCSVFCGSGHTDMKGQLIVE